MHGLAYEAFVEAKGGSNVASLAMRDIRPKGGEHSAQRQPRRKIEFALIIDWAK